MKRYYIDFMTRLNGIPCGISVYYYAPELPMQVTGTGMGDADPPEPEEFEFVITDHTGYPADWLAKYLTEDDEARILVEYKQYRRELNEY